MNIALVNIPHRDFGGLYDIPIHLGFSAALLEAQGHSVQVVDGELMPSLQATLEAIEDAQVVVIHSNLRNVGVAHQLAAAYKEATGGAVVGFGLFAQIFSCQLEPLTAYPAFDVVMTGEPEPVLPALVESILQGKTPESLGGLLVQRDGRAWSTGPAPIVTNLDDLPWWARHLFALDQYPDTFRGEPAGHLLTSRGCMFSCTFCAATLQGRFRRRSPTAVVDEIEAVAQQYGTRRFVFRDLTFGPKPHIRAICQEILRRGLRIQWYCLSHVNMVDPELLELMRRAGCHEIDFGVESGDQTILDRYGKSTTLETIQSAFRWCREAGIRTQGNLMLGGPYDTPETIRRSVEFFCKLDPDHVCITLVMPLPGTKMFEELHSTGRLATYDWSHYVSDPYTDLEMDRVIRLDEDVKAAMLEGYNRLLNHYFLKSAGKAFRLRNLRRLRPAHLRQLYQYLRWKWTH
jgi:radical SAM superfamily enzyme YgiQ (UPF0313 family)